MFISCHLVVWRIAQILTKKDLSFLASSKKIGLALAVSACCMLAKNIFYAQQTKKSDKHFTNFHMTHETEFTNAYFVILKVVKKWKISFFKKENFFASAKFCRCKVAICLGIYFGICRMPTQIARVVYLTILSLAFSYWMIFCNPVNTYIDELA